MRCAVAGSAGKDERGNQEVVSRVGLAGRYGYRDSRSIVGHRTSSVSDSLSRGGPQSPCSYNSGADCSVLVVLPAVKYEGLQSCRSTHFGYRHPMIEARSRKDVQRSAIGFVVSLQGVGSG